MHELVKLKNDLLTQARDEYVGLWVFVANIRRLYPEASELYVRATTLEIVRELLQKPDIRVGQFDGADFICWSIDTDSAIVRISTEWKELDREPRLGEIAWLASEEGCVSVE